MTVSTTVPVGQPENEKIVGISPQPVIPVLLGFCKNERKEHDSDQ